MGKKVLFAGLAKVGGILSLAELVKVEGFLRLREIFRFKNNGCYVTDGSITGVIITIVIISVVMEK